MHFTRTDSLKFSFYSILFFFLFFGYNKVSSPHYESSYDSASIENQEVMIPKNETVQEKKETEISYESPTNESIQKHVIPRKNILKDPFTIVFNPEYIKVDTILLDRIKKITRSSYFQSKVTPLNIILDGERSEPRGQVVGNKLILATTITDDSEQLKVFIHELGHIVDIFYLKKGLFQDPSDIFYEISWESFNTKKKGQKIVNFVSGYALSNKYEDFAESFSFYVFHNEEFSQLAQKDRILKQKYDFLHKYVFDSDIFVGTSFGKNMLKSYNWDTTKLPIDVKKYLYYIQ